MTRRSLFAAIGGLLFGAATKPAHSTTILENGGESLRALLPKFGEPFPLNGWRLAKTKHSLEPGDNGLQYHVVTFTFERD